MASLTDIEIVHDLTQYVLLVVSYVYVGHNGWMSSLTLLSTTSDVAARPIHNPQNGIYVIYYCGESERV